MKFVDLHCEWAQVLRGLEASQQVEATIQDKRFLLRSQLPSEASAALRATGVAPTATLNSSVLRFDTSHDYQDVKADPEAYAHRGQWCFRVDLSLYKE
jgi:hypothetical protein